MVKFPEHAHMDAVHEEKLVNIQVDLSDDWDQFQQNVLQRAKVAWDSHNTTPHAGRTLEEHFALSFIGMWKLGFWGIENRFKGRPSLRERCFRVLNEQMECDLNGCSESRHPDITQGSL